jgi:serine/threonine protein kinase
MVANITISERPSAAAATDLDQELANLLEQVTRDLQDHGSVDVEALAEAHPQHAHRLRELLPAMQAIADLGHSTAPIMRESPDRSVVRGSPDPAHPASSIEHRTSNIGQLGDFRILREIGRGGMGVVYEAEQLSIGRRVALKVLPFAAMLDRQQLNRFKNEARAAGTLDHPNIVAIHSVGCERGVHYYAMQLIEGQSLAQIVEQLRGKYDARFSMLDARSNKTSSIKHPASSIEDPASNIQHQTDTEPVARLSTLPDFDTRDYFRAIAQLGIQAVEALDHAHQNGILHRDIKPANLLVDDNGKLWITDFGLARMEQDAGMTMTGDILGTLRYMSPEQALAKRVVVDHRSDIYSLGITLYELLTLRPAFTGDDRQELLRQIAFEDPQKVRRINARIPSDLDTIILKAIEKNPADRYATAEGLADDLRAAIDQRPIKAKPPNVLARTVKWSRRHQLAMLAGLIVLAMLTVGLSVGSVLIVRERNAAVTARNEATQHFQLARDAVDKLMTRVAEEQLLNAPKMEHLRERLLTDALNFYQQMLERDSDSPSLRHDIALAQLGMTDILSQLNRREEASAAQSEAVRRLRELTAIVPENQEYRFSLAKALFHASGIGANGNEKCREAVELLELLHRNSPSNAEYAFALADAYLHWSSPLIDNRLVMLGEVLERLQKAKAAIEPLASNALASPKQRALYARILRRLGDELPLAGRREEAKKAFEHATQILRDLIEEDPTDAGHRDALATTLWHGANNFPPENPSELVSTRDECVSLFEGLVRDFPSVPRYRESLAMARMHLSFAYDEAGQHDRALEQLINGKTFVEQLCQDFPEYRYDYGYMMRLQVCLTNHYAMHGSVENWLRAAEDLKVLLLDQAAKYDDQSRNFYAGLVEASTGLKLVNKARPTEGVEWARRGFQRMSTYLEPAATQEQFQAIQSALPGMDTCLVFLLRELPSALEKAGAMGAAAEFRQVPQEVLKRPEVLGYYYAMFVGDNENAAKHFQAAVRANRYDGGAAHAAALSLLLSGNRPEYEAMCRHMLEQFGATQNQEEAWRTCCACLIAAPPVGELDRLSRLAEIAVPCSLEDRNDACRLRALAVYRTRDWEGALKWCAGGRDITKRDDFLAQMLLVEAMAFHQLGRTSQATAAYREAVALIEKVFPSPEDGLDNTTLDWYDFAFCELLRREAEALLKPNLNKEAATINP